MSTRNLDRLVEPRSIVAIGASTRPGSVGEAVTRNLLNGGFKGDIHLVNVKGGEIGGRPVLTSVSGLPAPADVAVIMTPPDSVPGLLRELGARGTKVAVVITAGPGSGVSARTAATRAGASSFSRPPSRICCASSAPTASVTPHPGSG